MLVKQLPASSRLRFGNAPSIRSCSRITPNAQHEGREGSLWPVYFQVKIVRHDEAAQVVALSKIPQSALHLGDSHAVEYTVYIVALKFRRKVSIFVSVFSPYTRPTRRPPPAPGIAA